MYYIDVVSQSQDSFVFQGSFGGTWRNFCVCFPQGERVYIALKCKTLDLLLKHHRQGVASPAKEPACPGLYISETEKP